MILVAGLSPAWQQIMQFSVVAPGEVNRAREVHWCASGKVLNVAIALQGLGARSLTLAPVGGWSGEAIRSQFADMNLASEWIDVPTPTRVCTTLLDERSGVTTELVENASDIPDEAIEQFRVRFRELASQADFIVLTGSTPANVPKSFYGNLLDGINTPALLDFRGLELMACLPHGPLVVKPNREELAATVRRNLRTDEDVRQAARELNATGAKWVVVTNGPGPILVSGPDHYFLMDPIAIDRVVNPIGCGDCLAAGLAFGLVRGEAIEVALNRGLRAAADNAGELLPARCQPQF